MLFFTMPNTHFTFVVEYLTSNCCSLVNLLLTYNCVSYLILILLIMYLYYLCFSLIS